MGGLLILACDNCIPGDASGWYLPLALLVLASLVGTIALWIWAVCRDGRKAVLPCIAGVALFVGPPVAVLAMMDNVGYDNVVCGSALSASLERPLPGAVLDEYQSGCRAKGERVVAAATRYGVGSVVAAAALVLVSLPPGRRRVAAA